MTDIFSRVNKYIKVTWPNIFWPLKDFGIPNKHDATSLTRRAVTVSNDSAIIVRYSKILKKKKKVPRYCEESKIYIHKSAL